MEKNLERINSELKEMGIDVELRFCSSIQGTQLCRKLKTGGIVDISRYLTKSEMKETLISIENLLLAIKAEKQED